MTLLSFLDPRGLSDYELGALLLFYFAATQAEDLGLPADQMPDEFVERVRRYVLTIEAATAENAAVEKALHKAASGDFVAAGKFLREHMMNEAIALKFIPIGMRRWRQAAKFGSEGAKVNKAEGDANRGAVLDAAKEILTQRERKPSGRGLAALVAEKTGIPANTVRGHLTKLRKQKKLD